MNIATEPRRHFSFSQLDNYLSCPHKYYLGYVQNKDWCFVPAAVAFGSTVHTTLEGFHRSLIAGAPQSQAHLENRFEQEWHKQSDAEKVRFFNGDNTQSLLDKGQALVGLYHDQFHKLKPKAVELDFRLPMIRTDTGELAQRDLVGKVDLLEEGNVPWEVKTSSRALAQSKVDTNMQLTLYSWALSMMYGEHIGTVKVVNLVKTKQPKIQVLETTRTPQDHQKLMKVLFGVNHAIAKQVFYPNPSGMYGCANCTFKPICEHAG